MVQFACLKQLDNGDYIFTVFNFNPTTVFAHTYMVYAELINECIQVKAAFSTGFLVTETNSEFNILIFFKGRSLDI